MVLKRDLFSGIFIIFLFGGCILSAVLFSKSLTKDSQLEEEISSKYKAINALVKKSKMPITEESVILLKDEHSKLNNIYARFKLAIASPLNEEISEKELDPLKFKEKLIQAQKKLREEAAGRNLSLPESLGFSKYETELSNPVEIPDLIKRLKILEELIYTIARANVDSLYEIDFTNKGAKAASQIDAAKESSLKKGIYYDIPVSLKINCTSSELVQFLYKLRVSPFVFVVDDLDIEKGQDSLDKSKVAKGSLIANLSIRAIVIN